jgi:hypothetical protein
MKTTQMISLGLFIASILLVFVPWGDVIETYERCNWCIKDGVNSPCECKTVKLREDLPFYREIQFPVYIIGLVFLAVSFFEKDKQK